MTRQYAVHAAGICLCLATAVVLGGGAIPTTPTLVVTDEEGTELLTQPVESGERIAIEYTHSVEQTPVTDSYLVTEAGLVAYEMAFSSFGAGLPAQADTTRQGSQYVYEPPARQYEQLVVTTGSIADHELVVGDQRYDLAALASNGTVELRIDHR